MAARSPGLRRPGFSLVELLLAVAILASAFLLVMGMFPLSFRGVHQGKHYVIASKLAESYMDVERTKSFPTMANNTYTDTVPVVVNGVQSAATYTTVVTVQPNPAGTASKAVITVQTQWVQEEVTGSTTARSIILESTRSRVY